jgi:acetate kinase
LAWLGIALDPDAHAPGLISTDASAVKVLVIATNEEAMIARHTRAVLQQRAVR